MLKASLARLYRAWRAFGDFLNIREVATWFGWPDIATMLYFGISSVVTLLIGSWQGDFDPMRLWLLALFAGALAAMWSYFRRASPSRAQTEQRHAADPDMTVNVALLEAATRAFENTRTNPVGEFAKHEGNPDNILLWYCYALAQRARLIGARAPSREPEVLPADITDTHKFAIDGDRIILKERDGGGAIKNVQVKEGDLTDAIHQIKKWGTTPPRRLDFDYLDKRTSFTLHELSYLWEDRAVEPLPLDDHARRIFQMLRMALHGGRFTTRKSLDEIYHPVEEPLRREVRDDEDPFNPHTIIGREELRRFANAEKVRPMFIFYDARAG